MTRGCLACLLAVIWLAVMTAPASAQSGLYEPFPSGHPTKQAKRYLKRLGADGRTAADSLSNRQIVAGAFLGGMRPAGEHAASVRAGEPAHDGSAWPFQLLLLLVPLGTVVIATRN